MLVSWLTKIAKYLPGIGTVIEKISGDSAKAEELRAQADLDDIKGFHRTGRVSASHLWKYTKVLLAILLALTFCIAVFYPPATDNLSSLLNGFTKAVKEIFSVGM